MEGGKEERIERRGKREGGEESRRKERKGKVGRSEGC